MATIINNPVFPLHRYSFQGVASAETLSDKSFKMVHADADGSITVTYDDGVTQSVTLIGGDDISVLTGVSLTSTASVKIS